MIFWREGRTLYPDHPLYRLKMIGMPALAELCSAIGASSAEFQANSLSIRLAQLHAVLPNTLSLSFPQGPMISHQRRTVSGCRAVVFEIVNIRAA